MSYDQRVKVTIQSGAGGAPSKLRFFEGVCRDKAVLHVGCADFPRLDEGSNLHLDLRPVCRVLDGLDVSEEGLAWIRDRVDGDLYSRIEDVTGRYDVAIVPEVLEHVGNAQAFLETLRELDFGRMIVTAPNAFMFPPGSVNWNGSRFDGDSFIEKVNPDHVCWYSPYTLSNVLKRAGYSVIEVSCIHFGAIVAVVVEKGGPR